jgi:hypothetical protein
MGARSLSVARLLSSHVPVSWQEAVAVVHAADELSAATGTRYSPEGCHLTTAGEVYLSPPSSSPNASSAMSSLQLLAALLGKPTSAHELRALVVAVDTTSAAEGDARLRLDLRWCLSADPKADVARLASRALVAEPGPGRGSGAQPERVSPPVPPARPRKPMASSDVADRQRHALTPSRTASVAGLDRAHDRAAGGPGERYGRRGCVHRPD